MKKLFIALPLVLIMVLTMIPVMAQEDPLVVGQIEVTVMHQNAEKAVKEVLQYSVKKSVFTAANGSDNEKVLVKAVVDALKAKYPLYTLNIDEKATIKTEGVYTVGAITYPAFNVDPTADFDYQAALNAQTTEASVCSSFEVVLHNVVTKEDFATRKVNFDKLVDKETALTNFLNTNFADDFAGEYQLVAKSWFGAEVATAKNCKITLSVLPRFQPVNVIHELYDCCVGVDGKKVLNKKPTLKFLDQNITKVDFIAYNTELMVDVNKAADYATNRLQQVNATDYVFDKAFLVKGTEVSQYLVNIKDEKGNVVYEVKNSKLPTIVIKYVRAECVEKAEEKVDNATVEANNTTTTAAAQLPATGVKDMTAFFMSAVALLGLGIFFAKKH